MTQPLVPTGARITKLDPELKLPVSVLIRYLLFLTRRPISNSNDHYLSERMRGLQSLAEVLAKSDIPVLEQAVQQLLALNPANFYRLAERVQYALLPLNAVASDLPRDLVVSEKPPGHLFFSPAKRILIVFGPGIGVGDELICFPLPRWFKQQLPAEAEVTVMSAYAGLWDRVIAADRVVQYRDHLELVQTLRGQSPSGRFDVTVLVDFERPDLYAAVAHESRVERYVELSTGAQVVFALDNRRRWLHRTRRPAPYFANFYSGLDYLLRWLGLSPRAEDRSACLLRLRAEPAGGELRVYVNPFTSKYDPSPTYWSHLLGSLFIEPPAQPARFAIDPGPNAATRRFADAVVRSAQARAVTGVQLEVARDAATGATGFERVFGEMERAHVAICADSFAAHAAPLFNCTTLVVANAGLENWRVPLAHVYYFSAEAPLDRVVIGMRRVLNRAAHAKDTVAPPPGLGPAARRLERSAQTLEPFFGAELDGRFDAFCTTYEVFSRASCELIEGLDAWRHDFGSLFDDSPYADAVHAPAPDGVPLELRQDFALHVQDELQSWRNTNLHKFLELVVGEENAR